MKRQNWNSYATRGSVPFMRFRFALFAFPLFICITNCRALDPPNKPLDTCARVCNERAKRECTEDECERGCLFIMDRLVEKQTDNVVACVAKGHRRCADAVWADCAVRIGDHADGGPPAPEPPKEDDD